MLGNPQILRVTFAVLFLFFRLFSPRNRYICVQSLCPEPRLPPCDFPVRTFCLFFAKLILRDFLFLDFRSLMTPPFLPSVFPVFVLVLPPRLLVTRNEVKSLFLAYRLARASQHYISVGRFHHSSPVPSFQGYSILPEPVLLALEDIPPSWCSSGPTFM